MSKELEAFERIKTEGDIEGNELHCFMNDDDINIVENGLKRLDSIDNANPSEALECLEEIKSQSPICHYDDGSKSYVFEKEFDTIKQSLLKAEKNRKDLELIEKVRSGKILIFVGKGLVMMNADKYHEYLKMEEEPISKKIKKCLKEQAWDIVVKKNVDMLLIKKYENVSDYNSAVWLSGREKLTEEEFDTVKEVLE